VKTENPSACVTVKCGNSGSVIIVCSSELNV
jgi:hypothetical protein